MPAQTGTVVLDFDEAEDVGSGSFVGLPDDGPDLRLEQPEEALGCGVIATGACSAHAPPQVQLPYLAAVFAGGVLGSAVRAPRIFGPVSRVTGSRQPCFPPRIQTGRAPLPQESSRRESDLGERTVAFGPVVDPAATRTRVPAIETRDLCPAPSAPYIGDLGMRQRHLRPARPFQFRRNRHDRKLPA